MDAERNAGTDAGTVSGPKSPWSALGAWMEGTGLRPGKPMAKKPLSGDEARSREAEWPRKRQAGSLPWLETVSRWRAGSMDLTPVRERLPQEDLWRSRSQANGLAALIHDARNMVTAIELYCALLAEPDVLMPRYRHYAEELCVVSAASRRLLERLGEVERLGETERRARQSGMANPMEPGVPRLVRSDLAGERIAAVEEIAAEENVASEHVWRLAKCEPATLSRPGRMQAFGDGEPIENLAEEVHSNQHLLTAVTGHGVTVGFEIRAGKRPLEMTREDLTRVLVNLARNAAEAMPGGGHLQIVLEETADALILSFTDTGRGLAPGMAERIFAPGYTTHVSLAEQEKERISGAWPVQHRGLGLAIVRSLVAAAGGSVWAANRNDGPGAIFTAEFPLRKGRGGMTASP